MTNQYILLRFTRNKILKNLFINEKYSNIWKWWSC